MSYLLAFIAFVIFVVWFVDAWGRSSHKQSKAGDE